MVQFICGTLFGGLVAVVTLCMVQVNRSDRNPEETNSKTEDHKEE